MKEDRRLVLYIASVVDDIEIRREGAGAKSFSRHLDRRVKFSDDSHRLEKLRLSGGLIIQNGA